MKKVLLAVTVLSLLAGAASLSTQAVTSADSQRGYISVNASANTELTPDVAEISIAVQTFDSKSMQKATLQNKEISDKVYSALKSMIKPQDGDYVKTSDFNASPVYTYSGSKRSLEKYQVSNRVIVHTKSIDKIGSMIDKAISLGATNVEDLTFSVSKYDTQCNELLGIAIKKAQNQAASIAKYAGTSVSGIRTMDVSCNANDPRMPYRMMLSAKNAAGDMAESSSTVIEQGVVKIFANVNASFFVK